MRIEVPIERHTAFLSVFHVGCTSHFGKIAPFKGEEKALFLF
jgi:hypothetical protein